MFNRTFDGVDVGNQCLSSSVVNDVFVTRYSNLFINLKSRQTREMKYNTKRIAEVQKNKNTLTNKKRLILYTHPCVQSNRFIIYTTLCKCN